MNHTDRIIERLRIIGSQDRQWLLRHLSVEERQRVLAALTGDNAENFPADSAAVANSNGRDHSVSPMESSSKVDARLMPLANASAEEMIGLLSDESDWAIVVLLQFTQWSWADEFLHSLTSARMESLRDLASRIGQLVKPNVGETLALIMAERLQRRSPQSVRRSMFDMALERAQQNTLSMIGLDKGAGE